MCAFVGGVEGWVESLGRTSFGQNFRLPHSFESLCGTSLLMAMTGVAVYCGCVLRLSIWPACACVCIFGILSFMCGRLKEKSERMIQIAGRRHWLCTPSCAQQFRGQRANPIFCSSCFVLRFRSESTSAESFHRDILTTYCHVPKFNSSTIF